MSKRLFVYITGITVFDRSESVDEEEAEEEEEEIEELITEASEIESRIKVLSD